MKLLPLCGVKQQFSAETLLQRHAIAFLAEEAAVAEETTQTNDKKAVSYSRGVHVRGNSPAVSRLM
jgi:hypothetical protein